MLKLSKKKIIREFFEKAFLKEKRFPSGSSCFYVKINNEIGIKCYTNDSDTRDNAFTNQEYAFNGEIAPKPYFKFDVHIPYNFNNEYESEPESINCYVTQHANNTKYVHEKEFDELCNVMKKLDFGIDDINRHFTSNLGRINGKLVCIDFDNDSVS